MKCNACGETYRTLQRGHVGVAAIVEGPTYCFQGQHTFDPLPDHDKRRMWSGLVHIEAEGEVEVQGRIEEALSPERQASVRILQIDGHMKPATLAHQIINLATLRLFEFGVHWEEESSAKLHLTTALTPNLKDLEIRNLPGNCDFKAWLPDSYSQIFRSYLFGPSGFRTMALICCIAKFDSFLSLDCARVEGVGVQSKERKG